MESELRKKANAKYFSTYVFLSTFARNLIETFVGTILFKIGFSLHEVIFYYLLVNIFSVILSVPLTLFSKKYSNKLLSVIGVISFIVLQIVLNYVDTNIIYLYITAFLYALYRRGYWISRRYYTLKTIGKVDISKRYSIITILNQLGIMIASYIGALLLEFFSINVITLISIILLVFSIYFIYQLKFEQEKNDVKIRLFETIKCVPKSSMVHVACFELQAVVKFLFPLFLIIYIENSYTTIGIVSLIANLATLLLVYAYGKIINNNTKNYLKISIVLFVLSKCFQLNTFGILLMIVAFMEGLTSKLYEQSFNKEFLILSKKFEYHNYNLVYEIVQSITRLIIVSILYFFIGDVKIMIYVVLGFILIGLFFNFYTNPLRYDSSVIWKKEE